MSLSLNDYIYSEKKNENVTFEYVQLFDNSLNLF